MPISWRSSAFPLKAAFRRRHVCDARVPLDCHAQRAPESLERSFRLVVRVRAPQAVDVHRHVRMVDETLKELVDEIHVEFVRARIGEFDVDLIHEFFQGFVNHADVTLHVDSLRGSNAHHQAETAFKAFGRALRMAVEPDPRVADVPSTKGSL